MLFRNILPFAALAFSSLSNAEVLESQQIDAVSRKNPSNVCARQLEQALYSPPTAAHIYMAKIAAELKVQVSAVLNGISNADYGYLSNFMVKYGVSVTVRTFYDSPFTFFMSSAGLASGGADTQYFTHTLAQISTGFDGFTYEAGVGAGTYNYGFIVQSASTATGAEVIIHLDASKATFLPVGC